MESSKPSATRRTADNRLAVCCFRLSAIVLAGLVIAYLVDLADFTMMFVTFLAVSGILRGTAAAIAAEEFWAGDLNRWDEAGLLIVLSLIVYWAGGLGGG